MASNNNSNNNESPTTDKPRSIGDCEHGIPSHLRCGACDEAYGGGDTGATLAARGSRYGHFADNARLSQRLKDVLRSNSSFYAMSADKQEGLDLIMTKIGRILTGDPDYKDNWHDIAGYAKLVERACTPAIPELPLGDSGDQ